MKTKMILIICLLSVQLLSASDVKASRVSYPSHTTEQAYPFFNASRIRNDAFITWVYNNPILVVFFHVERSTDGVNFMPVTEVMSSNNLFYRFRDRTVTQGTYYYRIVAYQHDGAILYSRTDMVYIGRRC
jgi:hypothetical protein